MRRLILALVLGLGIATPAHASLQSDWTARKQSITLSNGITLKYVEAGVPTGQPVILLHGYTDTTRSWSLAAQASTPNLASRYRVLAVELRGHGASAKPDILTIISMAKDIELFIKAKLGTVKPIVVGHSLGGVVAQQLALSTTSKGLIKKLALVSTSPYGTNNDAFLWVKGELPKQTWPLSPSSQFIADWTANANPVPGEFLDYVKREAAATPRTTWEKVLTELMAYDFRARLYQIGVPTLVLWGTLDPVFPLATQSPLRNRIPGVSVRTKAGAGHNIQWEFPAWVVTELDLFAAKP